MNKKERVIESSSERKGLACSESYDESMNLLIDHVHQFSYLNQIGGHTLFCFVTWEGLFANNMLVY